MTPETRIRTVHFISMEINTINKTIAIFDVLEIRIIIVFEN